MSSYLFMIGMGAMSAGGMAYVREKIFEAVIKNDFRFLQ